MSCNIILWQNNKFTKGYASQGGDVFLYNLKNVMAVSPVVISTHSHDGSIANDKGGAFYY
jgi:hypothetical protein